MGVAEGFMRVINFSDARNQLKQVIDQVVDDADFTVIAGRNAQDAVVMSRDTFNSLMETLHLMKSPANAKHLEKSIGQFRQDRAKTKELVDTK
jgi:antitoxin YefM